ncbi:MAG: hypothetical protein HYY23_16875 [Verrucomicrobia bacterium]|nr:hypothetical protein [Verrucomicrobiota bacterium]
MKTTLPTSVLAAVSLLVVMNAAQGQGPFVSGASHAAPTVATHACPRQSALKAQVFGNARWVALTSGGKLRCSTDGIAWNSAYLPVERFLRGVTYGNGQFVAVGGSYLGGGSVILTSVNGRSWNLQHCPSKQVLHAVAYSGNRFIAVGAGGTILTSKSGRCWQKQNSGTDATLAAIAFGNGTCVVGGDDGLMLSSCDAQTWTRQISGISRYVGEIAFKHGCFVATTGDQYLESRDGAHWQAINGATVPAGGLLARTNVTVSKVGPAQ